MESNNIAVLRIPGTPHQFFINMAYLLVCATKVSGRGYIDEFTLEIHSDDYLLPLYRIRFVCHTVTEEGRRWRSMLYDVSSPINYHLYKPNTSLTHHQRKALYDTLTKDTHCAAVRKIF